MESIYLLAEAAAITAPPTGTAQLLIGGLVTALTGLVSVIGWFTKNFLQGLADDIKGSKDEQVKKLDEIKEQLKVTQLALDQCTRSVTFAVLALSALVPGSKPMLEEAKAAAEARLKQAGL